MRTIVTIAIFQLALIKMASLEAIDHPIRHRHTERKNKSSQNSSDPRFSQQKLTFQNASKSAVDSSTLAMKTKSYVEKITSYLDSETSETVSLMDDKSGRERNPDTKQFSNNISSKVNSVLSDIYFVKRSSQVDDRNRNSQVQDKLKDKLYFPLVFEDYVNDSPEIVKNDKQSEFTRHNITVESINHREIDKQNASMRSKASIKNEDSKWSLPISDASSTRNNLNNTSTRILAPVGGDALLPCRVGHLGDRQVSWIRRRDWFVLTSGDSMYAHSARFLVLHEAGSQDWTLHIKRAVKGDSGMYECQVSTGTGIISFFVQLEVVIPTAHIPGNGRSHVYRGSPFTIFCKIIKTPSAMQHVMWSHNGEALNYQRDREDYQITTRVQPKDGAIKTTNEEDLLYYEDEEMENEFNNNIDKNVIVSRLKVPYAKEFHSGNYSCSGQNVKPATILIYVTEGDKTAAVQRIDSGSLDVLNSNLFLLLMLITLTLFT